MAAATTTWNPSDKAAGVTLSNGNLTATQAAPLSNVRAIASASSGKKYYEATYNAAGASVGLGVANAGYPLGDFLGDDLNAVGMYPNGVVFINNANNGTFATVSPGDIVGVAVDFSNSKIWYRVNAGGWNNDVIGNQNPATNTGGVSISGLNAGPYFPALMVHSVGDQVTTNFGASAYAQTPPSGFVNW